VPHIVTVSDSAAPKPDAHTIPSAADLERLRGGLQIIALRALGDPDAAEEAVQETIARAVAALADGRLDDPAKFPAYVAGIARHVCAHIVRDRKPTVPIHDAAESPGHPQLQTKHDPLEALISADENERLTLAFRTLSNDDQSLLRLCFHEGRSSAELAESLGEPHDRVRKRKSRALDRLRRAFLGQPEGHDDESDGTDRVAPLMPTDRPTQGKP
jgi:RNA polymerase sigma factor (sigma-70 family)